MTQAILEKINNKISQLQMENRFLRSFVIGILGKDKEGNYRPDFVKKIIKKTEEEGEFCFCGSEDFMKKIRS
ncbi:MAG: hypothetical protein PHW31_00325 [Candidatus Pacebacteria bacterium]|nr:hypothetical protein [Candidatus Paceibacterota bacterium]